ncbi:MAG: hypothetical protein RL368_1778 [Pseudomonadota bacterium]|jgi:hypothetical protein
MLAPEKTSLLCPCNDLESHTILELAHSLKLDVHQIAGEWGLTLDKALAQIADLNSLRENVLLVEMPDKSGVLLTKLQSLGKTVYEIDHHQYGAQKSTAVLSSLEQFAHLMNHKLNAEQLKIAINDRDFLMGLSRAGVPWEEAKKLREREWEIRGQAKIMGQARAFLAKNMAENVRDMEDVRLVLSPEEYSGIMLEAAQFPTETDYNEAANKREAITLKTVLILHHRKDNPEKIYQVEFAGPAKYKQALEELRKQPQWEKDFTIWQGGESGFFFGAGAKHELACFDDLVSQLLDICLNYGRPLRHYGCTFYVPLDLFLEADLEKDKKLGLLKKPDDNVFEEHKIDLEQDINKGNLEKPIGQEHQAYVYLLPHIRDLAFSVKDATSSAKPIRHFRLKNLEDTSLSLCAAQGEIVTIITDVSLFEYFNELYVLAVTVKPKITIDNNSSLNRDNATWWHDLVFSTSEVFSSIKALQLQNWLRFTNQMRIIYPSFAEQLFEGKMTPSVLKMPTEPEPISFGTKDKFSPILLHWVKQFFKDEQLTERLKFLPDDRMFVSVAYGLSGLPPKTAYRREEIKRLFSLALYVDHEGGTFSDLDGYAYDPKFTQNLMQQHCLNRWEQLGTHLGYCGYANAYLGFGWFFNDIIAPSHVPYIYGRMLLLALFYQATLRNFNRRVSYATRVLSESGESKHFRELRKKFILFTNNHWFREVSNQTQGIEVFELQTKNLGLEKEYALIKDEMERADEYSVTLRTEKFNTTAFLFVLVTLLVTVLTVDGIEDRACQKTNIFGCSWLWLEDIATFKDNYGLAASIALTAILLIGWLLWNYKSKWQFWKKA